MKKTIVLFLLSLSIYGFGQNTITFPSKDKLPITADLYETKNSDTFIILFHQAGSSRGEYQEIAPKLNTLGYHCLAVDQRSGNASNGIKNQTKLQAKQQGKATKYVDAFQDIEASIAYVKKKYAPKKIIIWGSSYSSSLVLKYAGDNPTAVQAVLSFSPGEYFSPKNFIATSAQHITIPTFITSARGEKKGWSGIYSSISSDKKQSFIPQGSGNHGSSALWSSKKDHKEYWNAVTAFLKTI